MSTEWTTTATVLTVHFCIILAVYIALPFIVRLRKDKFGMAYLHTRWYMLALFGCVDLQFENLLSEIINNTDTSSWGKWVLLTWIPYQFGLGLLHFPILVRGWRVWCIYTSTYDWRTCSLTSPLVRRRRDDTWLLARVFVLTIPLFITFGFLFLSYEADWGTVAYTAFTTLLLIIVAVRLMCLLSVMEAKLALETKWLLALSIMFLVYFTWQNISWYELQKDGYDTLGLVVEMVLVDILFILVALMWMTTPAESSAFGRKESMLMKAEGALRGFGAAHVSRGGAAAAVLSSRSEHTDSELRVATTVGAVGGVAPDKELKPSATLSLPVASPRWREPVQTNAAETQVNLGLRARPLNSETGSGTDEVDDLIRSATEAYSV